MANTYNSDYFKTILRNRYVVIIGDENMKSFYKDVVNFLQTDMLVAKWDLEMKGEMSFQRDKLFDGGQLCSDTEKHYKEVRQYQSPYHLIRFYYVFKVYDKYIMEILCSLKHDPHVPVPDFIVIGSCLSDISRYGPQSLEEYKDNVTSLCKDLKRIFKKTEIIWTTSLPVSKSVKGNLLGDSPMLELLPFDQLLANHAAASIADHYGFNVLDFYFHFKDKSEHRCFDGLRWDPCSYRVMTNLFIDVIYKINQKLASH